METLEANQEEQQLFQLWQYLYLEKYKFETIVVSKAGRSSICLTVY